MSCRGRLTNIPRPTSPKSLFTGASPSCLRCERKLCPRRSIRFHADEPRFLHEELSWSISKVDDELTPIVQRIARRGKVGALNKQATLDPFFDVSVATGNYAPRRRTTANVSKRLMSVIQDFREAEARLKGGKAEEWGEMLASVDKEDPRGAAYARRGSGRRIGEGQSSRPALKPSESNGSAAAGEKTEDGEEEEQVQPVKKPAAKRKRRAKASIAPEDSAEKLEDSGSQTGEAVDEEDDSAEVRSTKPPKKQKYKKTRGTRRWVGARWDVRERPEN